MEVLAPLLLFPITGKFLKRKKTREHQWAVRNIFSSFSNLIQQTLVNCTNLEIARFNPMNATLSWQAAHLWDITMGKWTDRHSLDGQCRCCVKVCYPADTNQRFKTCILSTRSVSNETCLLLIQTGAERRLFIALRSQFPGQIGILTVVFPLRL